MGKSVTDKAIEIFRQHGGILSRSEAADLGIHPRTLYSMRDEGVIQEMKRGTYRLSDLPPVSNPDLVSVALGVPSGVICLISALYHHEITTQIPHEVYVAVKRGVPNPRLEYPPTRVFWFPANTFSEGAEEHYIDGVKVRIYCPERSIADCFKYRNKIGTDVAVEALKDYLHTKNRSIQKLQYFAQLCRVKTIMRPYIDAAI